MSAATIKKAAAVVLEKQPASASYTDDQYQTALNLIAGYASTQRRLVMMLAGRDVDEQFQDDVTEAVLILSTTIGGLVDELSGNNIHGSNLRWHFGPDFERAPGGAA